jgi:hypothetical protein
LFGTYTDPNQLNNMENDKRMYLNGYVEMFRELEIENELFALTVVFKSGGTPSGSDRWKDEFTKYVLGRIRKRLDPRCRYGIHPITFESFWIHEFDTCSKTRVTNPNKVHHVHALLVIRKVQAYRIWDYQSQCANPKLAGSLDVMTRTISSWLLEPVRGESLEGWVNYMHKSPDSYRWARTCDSNAKWDMHEFNTIAESLRSSHV